MAGRHSKRRNAHPLIPQQRGSRLVKITDARTRVAHLMTDVSAMEHRQAGRYLALCEVEVLAASLAERERGQCAPCSEQAGSTVRAAVRWCAQPGTALTESTAR